jgi:putative membrane-bound dehydrogenase-like protein
MRTSMVLLGLLASAVVLNSASAQSKDNDPPKSLDPRLEIVQFAKSPDIVHPIAVDFDAKGRLLVVESHTHFRPKDYKGPAADRIRIVEDTDGDGKADKFATFHEGLKATMDLAVHFDGSVYVATRNEILRLVDKDGDGKADDVKRIAFLKTDGDYPHNGLSGLCFDFKGDLYFGLGENLGAKYELIGSDGTTLKGGGEGGNVYWCESDGAKLRRVATGFWNPFGICRDVFGRVFAVDNDPDAMPPCRLIHVVEGGDYGFQFRYGRSGRHPFQAWNGELPGTLPYVAGVGEAPSEVLAYESDGLPKDYLGNLLVTAWADHRLERYVLEPKGASFTAKKQVVIQGGQNFRPVGLAIAPDGSLFMSDWVRRDYNLHGHGALWQIRTKGQIAAKRPAEPEKAVLSIDRRVREAAARKLHALGLLEKLSGNSDSRIRATIAEFADRIPEKDAITPKFLEVEDPFIRQKAINELARNDDLREVFDAMNTLSDRARMTVFLADRQSGAAEARKRVGTYLQSPNEDIRFLTAKWISDDLIREARPALEKAMKDPNVNSRLYYAYGTALARLDGNPVDEIRLADIFLKRAQDAKASPASRVFSLRMVPTSWGGLQTEQLVRWLDDPAPEIRLEAVRALCDQTGPKRNAALKAIVENEKAELALRREALTGLADRAEAELPLFLAMAAADGGGRTPLSDDALRGLVNVPLDNDAKKRLSILAKYEPPLTRLIGRAIGRPLVEKKAPPADVDGWLKRIAGDGDIDAGRRVFFHPRLAGCYKCHRVDGRGADVGPDLSTIGRREPRFILESILQPSREVAPHFQAWQVETTDGKIRNGLLSRTNLDETTYIDDKGNAFTVKVGDIVEARPLPTSIMPDGLSAHFTDQELRDLLAYLGSRK